MQREREREQWLRPGLFVRAGRPALLHTAALVHCHFSRTSTTQEKRADASAGGCARRGITDLHDLPRRETLTEAQLSGRQTGRRLGSEQEAPVTAD